MSTGVIFGLSLTTASVLIGGRAAAQSSSTATDRTWLGWATGFIVVIAVIALTAAAVVWIRRKR